MADPRTPSPGGSDDLSQRVQEDARRTAERARGEAHRWAEEGSDQAASAIEDFADAIRRAQDDLGETHHTATARMVGEAAQGLEQLSRALARKTPRGNAGRPAQFRPRPPFGVPSPARSWPESPWAGWRAVRRITSIPSITPTPAGPPRRPATILDPEVRVPAAGPLPPASGGDTAGPTAGRRTPAGSVRSPSPEGPTPASPATRKD